MNEPRQNEGTLSSASDNESVPDKDPARISGIKLPGIIDNKYYRFLSAGRTGSTGVTSISVSCLLCPGGKVIQGDDKSSGNFVKHLKVSTDYYRIKIHDFYNWV